MGFNESLFNGGSVFVSAVPPASGFLGRFQVGTPVPLSVATVDGTGAPVEPDSAPTATVADADGNVLAAVKLPMDGGRTRFSFGFPLGIGWSLGRYTVTYSFAYAGGSASGTASATFDVIGGGDPFGRVISMYAYDRPEARYVVVQLSSGTIVQGRNPRL